MFVRSFKLHATGTECTGSWTLRVSVHSGYKYIAYNLEVLPLRVVGWRVDLRSGVKIVVLHTLCIPWHVTHHQIRIITEQIVRRYFCLNVCKAVLHRKSSVITPWYIFITT